MEEVWKAIKGFEGEYEVSNLGRVKSLTRPKWNGWLKERILRINSGCVSLRGKNYNVNTLVRKTFGETCE